MLNLIKNQSYRRMFLAQLVALLGTGLATIALSLLAFELAGEQAGVVLGTALAIKMLAYVVISPLAVVITERLPRKVVLVVLDIIRGSIAVFLPFVSSVWQIYGLIILLQCASAAFTPLFQASIPAILTDEDEYTQALSLSRFTYDLESFLSPLIAGFLLLYLGFAHLFLLTSIGFWLSAIWLWRVRLPAMTFVHQDEKYTDRLLAGFKSFKATPRLRGLFFLSFIVAAAGSMVLVNSVVVVQGSFQLSESHTAIVLMVFGLGSMMSALLVPKLLRQASIRTIMIAGGLMLILSMVCGVFIDSFTMLLCLWFLIGLGYGLTSTPVGQLLVRSAHAKDQPRLYSAQFALSHLCWLVTYPMAGWMGAYIGVSAAFALFSVLAIWALLLSLLYWPANDPVMLAHGHPELPANHPHLRSNPNRHEHPFVIDPLHPTWPKPSSNR